MGASNSTPTDPPSVDDPATVARVTAARFAMFGDVSSLQSHLRAHPSLPLTFLLSDSDRKRAALQWTDSDGDAVWFTEHSTLLHIAAIRGQLATLEWLVHSRGGAALIHATDARGSTPLLAAAAEGQIAIVRRLLELGAPINSANRDRVTALHLAAAQGHAELVSLLLRAGADASLTNTAGQIAESWAREVTSPSKRQSTLAAFESFRTAGSPVASLARDEMAQLQEQQAAMETGVNSCKAVAFRLAKLALSRAEPASSVTSPLIDRGSLESLLLQTLSSHSPVVLYLACRESDATAVAYRELQLSDFLLPLLRPFLDEPAAVIVDEINRGISAFLHPHNQRVEEQTRLQQRLSALEGRVAVLASVVSPACSSSSVCSSTPRTDAV